MVEGTDNKVDLLSIINGQNVYGKLFIQDFSPKTDATSKAPMKGSIHYKGKTVGFKVWDKVLQDVFVEQDLKGKVILASGTVDNYKDVLEVTIKQIHLVLVDEPIDGYLKQADISVLWGKFSQFINTELSEGVASVLSEVFKRENLFHLFQVTWAAKSKHDAQKGGLLNHTYKMLRLAKTMVENDARLAEYKDILYFGIIMHDIGKVYEISDTGAYTNISYNTHRFLGAEILAKHRDLVIASLGEKFYYDIISIQLGHHGEFGDKPTTIWAYLVHLIDMLECHTTIFLDDLEAGRVSEKNGNKTVFANGSNLVV